MCPAKFTPLPIRARPGSVGAYDQAAQKPAFQRPHLVSVGQRQPDAPDPAHGRLLADVAVPHAGSNEMMKLIIADIACPGGRWLHALAVARADQTADIERAHPPPCWMRKRRQKRLKPSLQISPPAFVHHHRR